MKNPVNKMTLTFPSRSSNESFARSAAAAFVAQLDPTVDELSDIKTAVSEAVTNSIVHAYKDGVGDIVMTVEIGDENMVEITVKDRGCGIEDIKQACQPMFTTGGQERSGMGFTIMETFMDSMKVRSVPGRGTVVRMKKRISIRGRFR
ncbi:MAG: anti-sigma F factor [Clostridia bacterium]|nr:anti-sigma F factor [Clostridia bacterium]